MTSRLSGPLRGAARLALSLAFFTTAISPARSQNAEPDASAALRGFRVHEWGTFTVLSGSDGEPVRWFQPPKDLTELPRFVGINPAGAKSAPVPSLLRMETPVLYFYPPAPLKVRLRAALKSGSITEWFPAPLPPASPAAAGDGSVVWSGELLPPTDPVARQRIPAVGQDAVGRHYVHARAVPEAWLFRSDAPTQGDAPNTDHFIFYRGKGDAGTAYTASAPDDQTVRLHGPSGSAPIPFALALSVTPAGTIWTRMPAPGGAAPAEAALDGPRLPTASASPAIAAALREALVAAGLTPPEAAGMVATWEGQWFEEPGTRILAILPRSMVDALLPLAIEPKPETLVRVFVARFEVLTPSREAALAKLYAEPATAALPERRQATLDALHLGRFGEGAITRVQALLRREGGAQ